MSDQLLTPTQAFERLLGGQPVEFYQDMGSGWRQFESRVLPTFDWFRNTKFRIPPTPLTFVEACELALQRCHETGAAQCLVWCHDKLKMYVHKDGRFYYASNVNALTVADLRSTDWRVE